MALYQNSNGNSEITLGEGGTFTISGDLVVTGNTTSPGIPTSTSQLINDAGFISSNVTVPTTFAGSVNNIALIVNNIAENTRITADPLTGTINYDVTTGSIVYYTTAASGNWTVNLRGSGSSTLNSIMSSNQTVTVTLITTQGATAYYNNALTIDGVSVPGFWYQGSGGAPVAGNANSLDVYTYTIIKVGTGLFTVLASLTNFS